MSGGEIQRSLDLIAAPGGVFEVRALGRWTASGYYDTDHIEKAAQDIEALNADPEMKGIYITLNEVDPALLARRANRIETRLSNREATTSDADITRRRWFLVDLDPARASGISSTDEEHGQALDMALKVAEFLKDYLGFPAPVMGDSGNGAHLLYRIDLPNDDQSRELITQCLQALDASFGGHGCDVDQTVFNAARISKIYGTVVRKGDNTPERPHRRACIVGAPAKIEVVPQESLTRLASLAEPEEKPQVPRRTVGKEGEFDLPAWLEEHRTALPTFQEKTRAPWKLLYIFDTCPWDPSHRDRSAWVGQLQSGALSAGCHHNGCVGKDWYALRDLVGDSRPKQSPVPTVQRPARVQPTDEPTLDELYEIDPKTNKIHLKFAKIADYIKRLQPLIAFQQRLWVYTGDRYVEDHGQIEALIQQTTRAIGYVGSISSVKREVLSYLKDTDGHQDYPFDQGEGYLPVKNGILHITADSVRLLPHGPEHRFTFCLPVAYDPATSSQFVADTFADWVGEDAGYLVQVPAQCILQAWGHIYKAAYLFEGQTNAGKTTYCDFLYAFFGEQTFSKVGLYALLENRFAFADLLGKMLNVQDDLPFIPLKSIGTFKDLTGGDQHRIERKHEQAFKASIRAVHLFTCNRPPEIKDLDDRAFWGRWVYLMFSNAFPVNPEFQRRLASPENLSGFLNLVIAKVQAVLRNEDCIKRMDPEEVRAVWTAGSSPVVSFIASNFARDMQAEIPKDEVYEAYVKHCQTASLTCMMKPTFSGHLARMGIIGCRPRGVGGRTQAYRGIRWLEDSPYRPSSSGQGGQGDSQLISNTVLSTDQTTLENGHGGQGIFQLITREKSTDHNDVHIGKLCASNPDHPDHKRGDGLLARPGRLPAPPPARLRTEVRVLR
ncbi:MAG: hypothetical protein PWP08_1282 [Methanofollis sp.]|nr:hypothetical protein [Methanofollis sp.]